MSKICYGYTVKLVVNDLVVSSEYFKTVEERNNWMFRMKSNIIGAGKTYFDITIHECRDKEAHKEYMRRHRETVKLLSQAKEKFKTFHVEHQQKLNQ